MTFPSWGGAAWEVLSSPEEGVWWVLSRGVNDLSLLGDVVRGGGGVNDLSFQGEGGRCVVRGVMGFAWGMVRPARGGGGDVQGIIGRGGGPVQGGVVLSGGRWLTSDHPLHPPPPPPV